MTYEEYISHNTITDNLGVCNQNSFYLFGAVFLAGYLFFTYRSPSVYLNGKDIAKTTFAAFASSYFYYKYKKLIFAFFFFFFQLRTTETTICV
jgi:hypothetical protein